ncbi:unnamed protein product, partial [Hymenolepis diminuta]
ETIENYRKLINDGNAFRDELRNELKLARKSASIARANLEEERRNQNRASAPVNPPVSVDTNRWLDVYKEENAKLRESVRVLTEKEINLASIIGRIKDHVEEEVERLIQSKGRKMERTFSGPWFMGLVGLLGVPCPSTLEYYLTTPSSPRPHSSAITKDDHRSRRRSRSITPEERPSSTLENILKDLEEFKTGNQSSQASAAKRSKQQRKRTPSPFQKSTSRKRGREEMKRTTRGGGGRLSLSSSSDLSIEEEVAVAKKPKRGRRKEAKISESHSSAVNISKKSTTAAASLNPSVTDSNKSTISSPKTEKRILRLSESATESDFEDVLPSMQQDSVDLDEVNTPVNTASPVAQRTEGGLSPVDTFFANLDEDSPDEDEPEASKSHPANKQKSKEGEKSTPKSTSPQKSLFSDLATLTNSDTGESNEKEKLDSVQKTSSDSPKFLVIDENLDFGGLKEREEPSSHLISELKNSGEQKSAENTIASKSNENLPTENTKIGSTPALPQFLANGSSKSATESESSKPTSPVKDLSKDITGSKLFGFSGLSTQSISSEANEPKKTQIVVSDSSAESATNGVSR